MFNTSLRDVLKENEKVTLDDSPIVDSIEDALGFIKENDNTNSFAQLRMKKNITDKEKSIIDLAEIFIPALARFKPGEIMEYLYSDAEDIRNNKAQRGSM
tara:strand:+ start:251 stop:550 length:300 start_codon:yes stop_codon:yes gene_type:complete